MLANAVRFRRRRLGGRAPREGRGNVGIVVADTGRASRPTCIVDRFQQADAFRPPPRGLGLGRWRGKSSAARRVHPP